MTDFIIIASTRTGSTMLDSAFNNCEGISSFGECLSVRKINDSFLNHHDPIIAEKREWQNQHSLYTWYCMGRENIEHNIKDDVEKYINPWLDWLYSLDDNVGWKLLWNNIDRFPFIANIIKERNIKVIHLCRDFYNRVKSMKRKFKHLEKTSYKELLLESLYERENITKLFPNRLDIYYEELTGNTDTRIFPKEATEKIFNWLELPYQPLKPTIRKAI